MKQKAIFLITLLLLLVLVNGAQAMSSANYSLDWMVPLTSGGGGPAVSTNYVINYTIGQSAIGESQSTNYATNLGFWQTFVNLLNQWLPLVFKM
jgi:hypothetical protein